MGIKREKLYEEVWSEAMTKVAKRYKVSSNYLARVCEQLNVPRPPRGYWAKLQFGKAPDRPELPDARPGDETEWLRGREEPTIISPQPPDLASKKPLRPASERPRWHPLVGESKGQFDIGKSLETGFFKPAKKALADVVASKETLPRALKVANQLYLCLEDHGYHVVFAPRDQKLHRVDVNVVDNQQYYGPWSPERPTVAYLGTVAVGLSVFELTEEAEVEWVDGTYVRSSRRVTKSWHPTYSPGFTSKRQMPNGLLCVRAYSPYSYGDWKREWREAVRGDISNQFTSIVETLEREAQHIITNLDEGQRKAEVERKKWEADLRRFKRQELERQRAEANKESREQLLEIVEEWELARRSAEFFEDAERRCAKLDDEKRTMICERLKKARILLGDLDALRRFYSWQAPDELGKGDYSDTLLEDQGIK